MAILGILVSLLVLGLILWPQYWVRREMQRHGGERTDFPGTGGELAQHLVDHYGLTGVGVEITDKGDHYDPETRMVRLSADNFNQPSLTAVAVAAHEVGHAMQHFNAERGLMMRQRLVKLAMVTDRIASIFFLAAPVLAVVVRTPAAFFALVAFGVSLLAVRIVVHLVTLPVEYDASFGKALPILEEGNYLGEADIADARRVLKAAAFTYVASAIMSLVDLARWVRILR
ncbi:MAG: zinc metallopeptidase [Pseudomonadota bacterium]